MYYQDRDKESAERWLNINEEDVSIEIADLAYLICNGFERCEYHCESREICGDDACRCVRSIFPSPTAYEVYTDYREQYKKMELAARLLNYSNEDSDG